MTVTQDRRGGTDPPSQCPPVESRLRGPASRQDDHLLRLRKIEGQVRGLQRMIEDDRGCPHAVIQLASATIRQVVRL